MRNRLARQSIAAIAVAIGLSTSAAFAAAVTSDQLQPALKSVKSMELPAKAVRLVKAAKPSDKEATALAVVRAVSDFNPSAVPAVVGSISKAEPSLASSLRAEAIKLQPKLAPELKTVSIRPEPTALPEPTPTSRAASIGSASPQPAPAPQGPPEPSPGNGKKKGHYKNP